MAGQVPQKAAKEDRMHTSPSYNDALAHRPAIDDQHDRMSFPLAARSFNSTLLSRNLRTSARTTMKVIPVPVRSDNYAYLLIDEKSKKAVAVDPYDLPKVSSSAQGLGVEIVACITTHHHDDHSGGNHVCEFG